MTLNLNKSIIKTIEGGHMDNIVFERVWEDTDFFEIEILAQSKLIKASTRTYTTAESINKLASKLTTFLQGADDRFLWENGERGDESTPFVSLEFWYENKQGHVVIEIYMELDDGDSYDRHNCCFFIKTEIGLLNKFGNSLFSLNEQGLGKRISLNYDNEK